MPICYLQDKCLNVADKYIEYELLLVSIDLILLHEQAYRHILFNRSLLNRPSFVSICHLFILFLYVDEFARSYIHARVRVVD